MLFSYHTCRRPPSLLFSHRAKRGPEVLFDIQIEHKAQPCVSVSEVKTYAEPPISCSPKKKETWLRGGQNEVICLQGTLFTPEAKSGRHSRRPPSHTPCPGRRRGGYLLVIFLSVHETVSEIFIEAIGHLKISKGVEKGPHFG